jgi:cob(I)alamin adenosyltransferase
MVNLTRIYTRTGDDGTTALGDLSRTSKNDPRLIAYADVDEANSAIGVVVSVTGTPAGEALDERIVALLRRVQNDLFDVGADLCTPLTVIAPKHTPLRVTAEPATPGTRTCRRCGLSSCPVARPRRPTCTWLGP